MFLINKYRNSNTKAVLESKTMRPFLRVKISCQNAHILKIYKRQKFKNAVCWYFCQAHFMLFVLTPKGIL